MKNMSGVRVVPALLAVAAALGVAGAQAAPSAPDAVEKTIRELEQAQDRAAVTGDRATLDRIFAKDYRMVSPNGEVIDRAKLFSLLMSGSSPPYKSAVYETQLVRNLGKVVVTVGMEDVVPDYGPNPGQVVHRRVTQVWEHREGRWQLILRHAMIVPEHLPGPAH